MIDNDENIDLTTAVLGAIDAALSQVWTALPCKVTGYDSATQKVSVRITVSDPLGPIPELSSIQVVFPRAGGYVMTLPIESGDTGLLLICALSPNTWLRSGSEASPQDTRRHALSSAVFLPGLSRDALTGVPDKLALGSVDRLSGASPAALGDKVDALFSALHQAISTAAPTPAGFAQFQAAWIASMTTQIPPGQPASVGSSDVLLTTDVI